MPASSRASGPPFLATIYKIWMLRYVDVPEDVGLTIAKEYAAATKPANRGKKALPKHIPVVATSNNRSTRTTLVPGGAGRYRLQVTPRYAKPPAPTWAKSSVSRSKSISHLATCPSLPNLQPP